MLVIRRVATWKSMIGEPTDMTKLVVRFAFPISSQPWGYSNGKSSWESDRPPQNGPTFLEFGGFGTIWSHNKKPNPPDIIFYQMTEQHNQITIVGDSGDLVKFTQIFLKKKNRSPCHHTKDNRSAEDPCLDYLRLRNPHKMRWKVLDYCQFWRLSGFR